DRSPTTDSELPYIGDESTTEASILVNVLITSNNAALFCFELPASKVLQVPRPTTGIISPETGIGRRSIGCAVSDGRAYSWSANGECKKGEMNKPNPNFNR